jgi:hypothetical protein
MASRPNQRKTLHLRLARTGMKDCCERVALAKWLLKRDFF